MRYAIEMSWPQIQALDRERTAIVMPVASVEQHGRHLPVGTDYLLMHKLVEALGGFAVEGGEGVILPILQFGLNTEHAAFPGTICLERRTLEDILCQQANSFLRHGFRRFAVLNTHGGNFDLLDSFLRTYKVRNGCSMINIDYYRTDVFAGHEQLFDNPVGLDVHAGEFESSLMLYLYPDLVNMDQDARDLSECNMPAGRLPLGWLTHELSRSGIIGDATYAGKEKGRAFFTLICDYVLKAMEEFLHSNDAQSRREVKA